MAGYAALGKAHGRFGILLTALIGLVVLLVLEAHTEPGVAFFRIATTAVLGAGLFTVSRSHRRTRASCHRVTTWT